MLWDSDGSQYNWDGNHGFWKRQIAVLSGPDGAKDLLTILKGPDCQWGSECQWVVEGSLGVQSPILDSEGPEVVKMNGNGLHKKVYSRGPGSREIAKT